MGVVTGGESPRVMRSAPLANNTSAMHRQHSNTTRRIVRIMGTGEDEFRIVVVNLNKPSTGHLCQDVE
jgi:hypothetical protein